MTDPTFRQLVQARKDQLGWSVRVLARHAGTGHSTVDRLLTGNDVMLSSALKIAAALGLDTADLGSPAPPDLKKQARTASRPQTPPARPASWPPEQPRCRECAHCDRDGSLICNDPAGTCHPGDCDPDEKE